MEGTVALTGGLAADAGLKGAIERSLAGDKGSKMTVVSHPMSIYAGAIGAAIWGAFRLARLQGAEKAA